MITRWFTVILMIVLVTGWMPAHPVQSQSSKEKQNMLVDSSDPAALRAVEAEGGELLAEYDTATLWEVPIGNQRTALQTGITPVDESIVLRGLTLQPGRSEPAVPNGLQQSAPAGQGLWIVQFAGPIQPDWLEKLIYSGLEPVAYLPNNAYVVWGEQPANRLQALAAADRTIEWQGAYHPFYRLSPDLRPGTSKALPETVDVTVQLYQTRTVGDTLARLEAVSEQVLQTVSQVGNMVNIRVRIPSAALAEVASWAEVLNVEPYVSPELMDEVQGQILAGNVTATSASIVVPTGPGYLAWLASKGFPADPDQYPIVDVTDDGVDSGDVGNILHPDFYDLGNRNSGHRVVYAFNCTGDTIGNAVGGHGNLNAGIIAGYNALSGPAYKDANGYSYGLGISPYGRIGSSKVFSNGGTFETERCAFSLGTMVENAYLTGARITSNSWGAPVSGMYTADAQAYDYLTRDASIRWGDNQEMFHIFAAGNNGYNGDGSMGSPGSAKNVLTVGATENVRDQGMEDGCSETNANNAGDIAGFSSRGPAADGRVKPDIVAPGTHIIGPASQDPEFNGSGVCGMYPSSSYYPLGQKLYTWSTGTSHSTPAVAGLAQLSYSYYKRVLMPGVEPSPAMQKALILNTPRYLKGVDAGDTLPSNTQGWGMADLGAITDGTPRILLDQSYIFRASGEAPFELNGTVADATKPFLVSLVWTDAPGNTAAGIAAVNNLNLEVVAGGKTYRGNVFDGDRSITGGDFDKLNNVENIFLPTGISGAFRIRVYPQTIAGDGVPNNGSFDQDFALVVYNGSSTLPAFEKYTIAEVSGDGDAYYDPGETFTFQISLKNLGTAATGAITATLTTTDPQVTITNTAVAPSIGPGASQNLAPGFQVKILSQHACEGSIPLTLYLSYNGLETTIPLPDLQIGREINATQTFAATDLPVSIPLYTDFKSIPIKIQDGGVVEDVNVKLSVTHSYVSDLILALVGPNGESVRLSNRNGGSGANYTNTGFDDEAVTPIYFGEPPYTGQFQPEEPLSVLDGSPSGGTWTLEVYDFFSALDSGTVTGFSLEIRHRNQTVCTTPQLLNKLFLPNAVR